MLILAALLLQDVDRFIRDLGADDPDKREKAVEALLDAGDRAIGPCREALRRTGDPETQAGLRAVLLDLDPWSGSQKLTPTGDLDPVLTPDHRIFAYIGWRTTGESDNHRRQFVRFKGRTGKEFMSVRDLVLSPDGKRVAYLASPDGNWERRTVEWSREPYLNFEGGRWQVVVDEFESALFDEVTNLAFSPDGKRVMFTGKADGRYFVHIDGKKEGPFDHVGSPRFTPRGEPVFVGRTGQEAFVFVGDRKIGPFKYVYSLDLDREGNPYYVAAMDDGPHAILANKTDIKLEAYPFRWAFSPEGRDFAYSVMKVPGGEHVVHGDWKSESYYVVENLVFSPDGTTLAFMASTEPYKGSFIVVDRKEQERFKGVWMPRFLRDGHTVAYKAEGADGSYAVVGGSKRKLAVQVYGSEVFNSDGNVLAYVAQEHADERRMFVVAGSKQSDRFREAWNPVLSPDGKRVAFLAQKDGELWRIVMDVEP